MRIGRTLASTVALACCIALPACSASTPATTDPLAGYQHVGGSASWATWFTTLPQLAAKTDLAVSGTISKVVKVDSVGSDPSAGILQTTYEFTVDRVLLGDPKVVQGGTIQVAQTGGVDPERKIVFDFQDDPRFQVGETAVLFLTKVTDPVYAVQGGPSGRFSLKNGLVSATVPDGVPIAGVPLDTFKAQLLN